MLASPLVAGALGSGLGSAAQSGSLEEGIKTGLLSFLGGQLAGRFVGGGADALSAAKGVPAGLASLPDSMQGAVATPAMAGATPTPAAAPSPGGIGALRGAFSSGQEFLRTPQGMGMAAGSMLAPALGSFGSGGRRDTAAADIPEMQPLPRQPQMPGPGFRPGVDPEADYGLSQVYPYAMLRGSAMAQPTVRMQEGGAVRQLHPYVQEDGTQVILEGRHRYYDELPAMPDSRLLQALREQGVSAEERQEIYRSLLQEFLRRNAAEARSGAVEGYETRRYQEGGIASLEDPMGMGGSDKQIVERAMAAVAGQDPQPELALGVFVSRFGEKALRALVSEVRRRQGAGEPQGQVQGAGDGMDDLIPASIEGQQDVLLSDGEFVIPADVVSGLGNGSTDAGARQLEQMNARVREMRTGGRTQASQIDPEQALPV
jgi:hypothetical protein